MIGGGWLRECSNNDVGGRGVTWVGSKASFGPMVEGAGCIASWANWGPTFVGSSPGYRPLRDLGSVPLGP